MAETFAPDRLSTDKADRYAEVAEEIAAVLAGEPNRVARMATMASMLAASFEHFFWTGFYLVDTDKPQELVVGPYQGTLGCLRIAFGRGVCGKAAATGAVQIVDDVLAFPDHIACDARSRSEIVLPVFGAGRRADGRVRRGRDRACSVRSGGRGRSGPHPEGDVRLSYSGPPRVRLKKAR